MRNRWGVGALAGASLIVSCKVSVSAPFPEPPRLSAQVAGTNELSTLALFRTTLQLNDIVALGLPTVGGSARLFCRADSTGVAQTNTAGVPRDLTLRWPAGRCDQTVNQTIAQRFAGSVRLQDLGGPFAALITYTDVRSSITALGTGTRFVVDGSVETKALSTTTGRIVLRTRETQEQGPASSTVYVRVRDLTTDYTDTAGVPRPRTSVGPPVRLSFAGTLILQVRTGDIHDSLFMRITTPVAMEPDPSCPLSGYRAGELNADVTGTSGGSVRLRFSCR